MESFEVVDALWFALRGGMLCVSSFQCCIADSFCESAEAICSLINAGGVI
jgi:hypothetical protein